MKKSSKHVFSTTSWIMSFMNIMNVWSNVSAKSKTVHAKSTLSAKPSNTMFGICCRHSLVAAQAWSTCLWTCLTKRLVSGIRERLWSYLSLSVLYPHFSVIFIYLVHCIFNPYRLSAVCSCEGLQGINVGIFVLSAIYLIWCEHSNTCRKSQLCFVNYPPGLVRCNMSRNDTVVNQ